MQKGIGVIYILVGVLVLAVVAGGAYYLGKSNGPKPSTPVASQTPQPTPSSSPTDETANWKTYSISRQFEFKYPIDKYSIVSGVASVNDTYPGQIIIRPNDSYSLNAGSNIYILTISPLLNRNHLTLQSIDSLLGIDNSKNQFPAKPITIGGISGVKFDNVPGHVSRTEIYVIKFDSILKEEIIYNFTLRTLNGGNPSSENQSIIDNILSTFKFTQ